MAEYLRQATDLQIHAVEGGYIVRNMATNAVHHLNGTAALLLELCTGQMTADEAVDQVQGMFALSTRQLRTLREALDMLISVGLVVRVRDTTARKADPAPKPRTTPGPKPKSIAGKRRAATKRKQR